MARTACESHNPVPDAACTSLETKLAFGLQSIGANSLTCYRSEGVWEASFHKDVLVTGMCKMMLWRQKMCAQRNLQFVACSVVLNLPVVLERTLASVHAIQKRTGTVTVPRSATTLAHWSLTARSRQVTSFNCHEAQVLPLQRATVLSTIFFAQAHTQMWPAEGGCVALLSEAV